MTLALDVDTDDGASAIHRCENTLFEAAPPHDTARTTTQQRLLYTSRATSVVVAH